MQTTLFLAIAISLTGVPPESTSQADRYALLVGCTRYPALPVSMQLRGPANDVALMKKLLIDRFDFSETNIATLTEEAGGEERLPTRENIVREFTKLTGFAKAGDQVVILLAGHGSQQPDDNHDDPDDFEPDGLDEIFLPRDIGEWDGSSKKVKNAIVDDELRTWLGAINKKGASVWIVIDACHSGTMIRDASDERPRQVPPDFLVPSRVVEEAQHRSELRENRDRKSPEASFGVANTPGIVAIYAAQSTEPTIEKSLPPGADNRRPYGLLTYTINQVLTQSQSPTTYRELAQRVHQQYTQWGRTYPTPVIEGTDCDREVLGMKVWTGRSRTLLSQNPSGQWSISAGGIHGITTGSILAVYPPAGHANGSKPLGHVRVVATNPLDATVVPTDFSSLPANRNLPVGGRCEVVQLDYGEMRLRVAIVPSDSRVSESARLRVSQTLDQLAAGETSLLSVVSDSSRAQWLVHVERDRAFLVPANGQVLAANHKDDAPAPIQPWLGPVPIDDTLGTWLQDRLARIARVQNLLQMAGSGVMTAPNGDTIKIDAEMVRFDPANPASSEGVKWSQGQTVQTGEIVGFRVRNTGREPIDVTLLFIDGSYGISAFFPQPGFGADARLEAGKEFLSRKAKATPSASMEHMLVIAVRSEPQRVPIDFTCLCQPSIEKAEATRGASQGLDTPLGRLFQKAVFARGGTRGLDSTSVDTHTIRLISWNVLNAN